MSIFKNFSRTKLFLGTLLAIPILISGQSNQYDAAQAQTVGVNTLAQLPSAQTNIIYVNPVTGNDVSGKGTTQVPLRTITRALSLASEGSSTIIQLTPGNYTTANGEVFPLRLKAGTILRGNEETKGAGILIFGGANYAANNLLSPSVAIVVNAQSELRGVTVSNQNARGYGLLVESASPIIANNTFVQSSQDGVLVTGASAALISGNIFSANNASNITVETSARPEIRGNVIQKSGFGITIKANAEPSITSNLITGNQEGILVQANAKPLIRSNTIEKSLRNGIVILANSRPNLGSVQDLGNNIFAFNAKYDIQNASNNNIEAVGNQLSPQKISGKIQIATNNPTANLASLSLIASPSVPSNSPTWQTISSPSITTGNLNNLPKNFSPNNSVANSNLSNSNAFATNLIPIPGSIIVRISSSQISNPVPPNTVIAQNLPPVLAKPPVGEPVNQPIVLAPKANWNARASNPRYRVIVPITSESSASQVRRIVPNAFPSRLKGQLVVQVGAYTDRAVADLQVKKMRDAGFSAAVELIDR